MEDRYEKAVDCGSVALSAVAAGTGIVSEWGENGTRTAGIQRAAAYQ